MNQAQVDQNIQQQFNEKSLPNSWADFLNKPEWRWALYGHYTFRDVFNLYSKLKHHVHPETADKIWMKFIHNLNRETYGVRYTKDKSKGVVWARASEYQIRGAIHYHALIGCVSDDVRRFELMKSWDEMAGYARIYIYKPGHGAEFYMSKSTYAWKRGEIDLGGPLAARLKMERDKLPF